MAARTSTPGSRISPAPLYLSRRAVPSSVLETYLAAPEQSRVPGAPEAVTGARGGLAGGQCGLWECPVAHCRSVRTTVLSAAGAGQCLRATSSSHYTQVCQRRCGDSAGCCAVHRTRTASADDNGQARQGDARSSAFRDGVAAHSSRPAAGQRVAPRFTLHDSQVARGGAGKELSPSAHQDGAQGTRVSRSHWRGSRVGRDQVQYRAPQHTRGFEPRPTGF